MICRTQHGIIGIGIAVAALFGACMKKSESPPPDKEAEASRRPPADLAVRSAVDAILDRMEFGQIAFTVPPVMRYQEPKLVELLLSTKSSAQELQAELDTRLHAQSARVRITDRMEAQLTGMGFSFEAIEPPLQAVSRQGTTRWRWEVIPKGHGALVLHLKLYAHIEVSGLDTPYVIQTYDRPVEVQITAVQRVTGFIHDSSQWLWPAVLVPIAGYLGKRLWKRLMDRRRRAKLPPSPPALHGSP